MYIIAVVASETGRFRCQSKGKHSTSRSSAGHRSLSRVQTDTDTDTDTDILYICIHAHGVSWCACMYYVAYNTRVTPASRPVIDDGERAEGSSEERGEAEESWALGPGAVAGAGGHVAVAGALVLVAGRPGRHAVAVGAADPAVLEAVVVPARLGAPPRAVAVAELCRIQQRTRRARALIVLAQRRDHYYTSTRGMESNRRVTTCEVPDPAMETRSEGGARRRKRRIARVAVV